MSTWGIDAKDAAKHPAMVRAAGKQSIIWSKVSAVLRARKHGLGKDCIGDGALCQLCQSGLCWDSGDANDNVQDDGDVHLSILQWTMDSKTYFLP